VSASYLQNQVTENTGVSAGLNQRLLGKLFPGFERRLPDGEIYFFGEHFRSNRTDDLYDFQCAA
jgi:hypothetical protein